MRNKIILLIFALWLPLAGCGANMTLMSAADEARIGRDSHPKIVAEFGGVYDNPQLTAYVERVFKRMVAASDKPDATYQITILDSPVVNAFALPGGYTYVTRGLLAIANNEAELAGVIGHEIAHVTERHGARRHSTQVLTEIFVMVLEKAAQQTGVDPDLAGEVINVGGNLVVLGYSRSNEYDADSLGIEALARAGYDPKGQAGLLLGLERQAAFSGHSGSGNDWFSTHPNSDDRVAKAYEKAAVQKLDGTPDIGAAQHLQAINGMVFGEAASQGFVRNTRFVHPNLRIAFSVPEGFTLINQPERVVGQSKSGIQIIFDIAPRKGGQSPTDYIKNDWASGQNLEQVTKLRVDGTSSALAQLYKDRNYVGLLAIGYSDTQFLRFAVLAPNAQASTGEAVMNVLRRNFENLSAYQANNTKPLRIRIITVQSGDTLKNLSRYMKVNTRQQEVLQMINGFDENTKLTPGQRIKIVAY